MLSKGKMAYDGNFDDLRLIQSGNSRIVVTKAGEAPLLMGLKLISSDLGIHEYEFDRSKIEIKEIIFLLAQVEGISDIEIRKAPMEQVIGNPYKSWKQ